MRLFLIIVIFSISFFVICHYSAIVIRGCCRIHIIIQQREKKQQQQHNTISCKKRPCLLRFVALFSSFSISEWIVLNVNRLMDMQSIPRYANSSSSPFYCYNHITSHHMCYEFQLRLRQNKKGQIECRLHTQNKKNNCRTRCKRIGWSGWTRIGVLNIKL